MILFGLFSYKKFLQCSFYENLQSWCKNRFFRKKFKKVCVLQRRACNKFKRNYLENYNDSEHAVKTKNASFFMIFPNISFSYDCNLLDWSFKGQTKVFYALEMRAIDFSNKITPRQKFSSILGDAKRLGSERDWTRIFKFKVYDAIH